MPAPVEDAIAAIAAGNLVVVVDDENRENEGDLVAAAEAISPSTIAFMMKHGRGLICCSLPGARLDALELPLMVPVNSDPFRTAFTVTVDLKHGTSTGISAADRAATIRALVNPRMAPNDFARPGHVFPLRASPLGVLGRPGHTEAAVDLSVLAGFEAGGVLCEIANDDGTMARLPELIEFARMHGLPIISIEQLIAYRRRQQSAVERIARAGLPTRHDAFEVPAFRDSLAETEHLAS